MPDLRRDTLWASELLGAEVVARQQRVAEVTDLLGAYSPFRCSRA